jgi:hypothetical protein
MSDDRGAAPPPEDTAVELFRALRRLHGEGRVALRLDYARLHHIDCPVAVDADSNIIAYGVVVATLAALWLGGWWASGATLAVGAAIYGTIGRRYVRGRIRRRTEEQALGRLDLWQRLWRFGGVALVPKDGGADCVAPQGNWMALVRSLRTAG